MRPIRSRTDALRLELRRNMRSKWIWVVLSADAHIVNRSTVDFETREACAADAAMNGIGPPDEPALPDCSSARDA
jgi:hypothetical protein